MILYARQAAWLWAVPEGREQSRMLEAQERGIAAQFPPVRARHLVGYLHEMGFAAPGANAPVGLPASEIAAWSHGAGIELDPWEFTTLMKASSAFAAMSAEARDRNCFAPYADLLPDRQALGADIASALAARAG